MVTSLDSFGARATVELAGGQHEVFRLAAAAEALGLDLDRLPLTIRVLLENLLRNEDGHKVTRDQIEAVAAWDPAETPDREVAFTPARVLLQDLTGVPAVVDLAAMRDAMAELGGDPRRINPLQPVELVIDHSVQVDDFGSNVSLLTNVEREYERNVERYELLRWSQGAFDGLRVVPPGVGIVHQVNLEYLASVVMSRDGAAYPDTLVGTDSHTTMINGLGVVGWGVGGIEAEAAMLGQPYSMLLPQVIGVRFTGSLPEGATSTDLVLRVTELLRGHNAVDKFVEYFGEGLAELPLAARATIANMCPEYGATVGFFPVDDETLNYMRFSGRDDADVALVEQYCKLQGLFRTSATPDPQFSEIVELDLGSIEPSIAGPKRPQDRIVLDDAKQAAIEMISTEQAATASADSIAVTDGDASYELANGAIVIAAITSCTNTSNPELMIGAGLLAKKAVERGLTKPPWVKSSLAPGSKVVTDYLNDAGLSRYLDDLGFNLVGYGCTTCIGNSGPLPLPVALAIDEGHLAVASVLSGNRNFEARVHNAVRANYLASPPLVVAYALAGRIDLDLVNEPIGEGTDGPVYLHDIWPSQEEVSEAVRTSVQSEMFRSEYANAFTGDERWQAVEAPSGDRFAWRDASLYIRRPSFLEDIPRELAPVEAIEGARALLMLGNSVTTDHVSPAGGIVDDSAAAEYLLENDVQPTRFNTYGSRRGNHQVMMRGTFANVRLNNGLVEREGSWTAHLPDGEEMLVFDAAERYREEGVQLIVLAGQGYGTGSSRDWAAKGPALLGIRAVIAESFERIHRSNLIGMGILPLVFAEGESAASLGLTGSEQFYIPGAADAQPGAQMEVRAVAEDGSETSFTARCRIDTPVEVEYYQHGGILPFVLRGLLEE
ncbi:MAG TPA: aconitate hydratase AcnA [Dehalococcoidia bacterium]|jgi:aconitate hydratase|nr:aconitate hydratase AcnA [Dehalococcoidia bacterium]